MPGTVEGNVGPIQLIGMSPWRPNPQIADLIVFQVPEDRPTMQNTTTTTMLASSRGSTCLPQEDLAVA